MEQVVLLHESIHEIQSKKKARAYDKVKMDFPLSDYAAQGLWRQMVCWMMKIVRGGRVAIKVNDQISPYFPTFKGVGQGNRLSPLLFNIITNGLVMWVKKAQRQSLISHMVPNLVDGGLELLQYVDDTIFL